MTNQLGIPCDVSFLFFCHSFRSCISQYYVAAASYCETVFLFLLNDCYQFPIRGDGHPLVTWAYKPVWERGDKPKNVFPRKSMEALRRSLCFLYRKKVVMSDCRKKKKCFVDLSDASCTVCSWVSRMESGYFTIYWGHHGHVMVLKSWVQTIGNSNNMYGHHPLHSALCNAYEKVSDGSHRSQQQERTKSATGTGWLNY